MDNSHTRYRTLLITVELNRVSFKNFLVIKPPVKRPVQGR